MTFFALTPKDSLYYEYDAPTSDPPLAFVFINAITGDASIWQAEIGPALRDSGYGTLAFNFRGQEKSTLSENLTCDEQQITSDLQKLLAHLQIPNPVLVGLSIGGLYAAKAYLGGSAAVALVLVNTLRKIGPRIAWMNDATVRMMEVGGPALLRDIISPLIFGPRWLAANRGEFLKENPAYDPVDRESGIYNLLRHMGAADWDIPYEQLKCPVLVVTGPHDRIFYDPSILEELSGRIPDAQNVIIPEAGHMLPAECGVEFSKTLLDFAQNLRLR